ncbi:MAG TPA: ABC-2 family transporter protein [Armatimonadota bacterium]|nr:ABC-2 family transporter protein [Armatimonadota bacterium]
MSTGAASSPDARGVSALRHRLRAYAAVFTVQLQDSLAYRGQALIWMLSDTVPALVLPLVWLAAYNGRSAIGGFQPSQIVAYYFLVLFLTNFMISHLHWDISEEIKEGRLSNYLTRPLSYMAFQYLGNSAWRIMRTLLFLPILALAIWLFRGYLRWEGYHVGAAFWVAVLLGHILSFVMAYGLGMLALFFVQARDIYNFYYMMAGLLSGQTIPLTMLPHGLQTLANLLPFRYTLGFAAEIFLGQVQGAAIIRGMVVELLWMVVLYLWAVFLWRRGLRYYTAVGI